MTGSNPRALPDTRSAFDIARRIVTDISPTVMHLMAKITSVMISSFLYFLKNQSRIMVIMQAGRILPRDATTAPRTPATDAPTKVALLIRIGPGVSHYMDDILSQAKMLEWAGVTFGQNEWYKLRLAMKKLLVENNCEYIRFFGKIYGTNSDYYILQGIVKDYPMLNPPKHVETRGSDDPLKNIAKRKEPAITRHGYHLRSFVVLLKMPKTRSASIAMTPACMPCMNTRTHSLPTISP